MCVPSKRHFILRAAFHAPEFGIVKWCARYLATPVCAHGPVYAKPRGLDLHGLLTGVRFIPHFGQVEARAIDETCICYRRRILNGLQYGNECITGTIKIWSEYKALLSRFVRA